MTVDKIRKFTLYSLLLITIVLYSAGKEVVGDIFFKCMLLWCCISVIIAIVKKTYQKIKKVDLWQLTLGYGYFASFYVFALLSEITIKNHYKIIALEAFLFLLQAYWIVGAFWENREKFQRKKWSFDKAQILLGAVALVFGAMIFFQSKGMYRWDSLDYAQQIVSMAEEFDFTLSCLQAINRIHISMGFAAVYEFVYFMSLGNANFLIWTNLVLGILTEISIYQIIKNAYPQKKPIMLATATCLVILMPLYYGVNGAISTDYIMANFFVYFLLAHIKKYRLLQMMAAAVMVMTKETAVVLLAIFCFSYVFWELLENTSERKSAIIKREGTNFIPIILWGAIFLTKENSKWLNITSILNLKSAVLAIVSLIPLLGILFFICYKWKDKVIKCFQFLVCIIIIMGTAVSVFSERVQAVYGPMEQLNSIGFLNMEYILLRLKNLFVLNFQWIYWAIIVVFLMTDMIKNGRVWKNRYVISLSLSVLMFVAVHCIYITYTHPRYYQPVVLLIGIYAAVLILEYEKKWSVILLVTVTSLTFVQNFVDIDFLSKNSYQTVNTGNGEMITTAYCKKELPYSDASVYNFEYTYLNQLLLQFVKDVEPDKKTLFLIDDVAYPYLKGNRSKYSVWGNLWYSDYGRKVYFDGNNLNSFKEKGNVEIKIKTVNCEREIDLTAYDRVYYLEIPEKTDAENTTQWFKTKYPLEEFRKYKVMNWAMNAYVVNNAM